MSTDQRKASGLGGELTKLKEFLKVKETEAVLEQVVEDGLVTFEQLSHLGIS